MYTSILVPLDGSSFAERALPTAAALARRMGAPLELVHVHDPLHSPAGMAVLAPAEGEHLRALTHDRLTELARRLAPHAGGPVRVTILAGPPIVTLCQYIADRGSVLVVMATHGASGFSRLSIGSMAEALVRHAAVPALLVHAGALGRAPLAESSAGTADPPLTSPGFARILVPLDGSAFAEAALEHALLLGDPTSTRAPTKYTLLRVVPPQPLFLRQFPPAPAPVDAERLARDEAEARGYLDGVAAAVRRRGFTVESTVLVDADPARAIVTHADAAAHGYELVVMATHSRGAAMRLLLGSVADRVLRSGHTPVVLFHPPAVGAGAPTRSMDGRHERAPERHGSSAP